MNLKEKLKKKVIKLKLILEEKIFAYSEICNEKKDKYKENITKIDYLKHLEKQIQTDINNDYITLKTKLDVDRNLIDDLKLKYQDLRNKVINFLNHCHTNIK